MSLKSVIYAHLQTVTAVTNLLGTSIYPLQASQDHEPPYVIFTLTDTARKHHMRGTAESVVTNLQMDVYAKTDASADTIATALLNALDSLSGVIQGTYIGACLNRDEDDGLEEPIHGEGLGTPARILGFLLAYNESARAIHAT